MATVREGNKAVLLVVKGFTWLGHGNPVDRSVYLCYIPHHCEQRFAKEVGRVNANLNNFFFASYFTHPHMGWSLRIV
ncbi:hypothetical protein [Candidatus Chloroploca sp. Khr17]|uniref:hypothetical protein n=1 Tax=Candidatus Chloroploca sp. Khr17 TaxID=2496869 RepID=UPI00101CCB3F|nr:hypothetical protein [Candidatus Chloroploca sp. Khr17]